MTGALIHLLQGTVELLSAADAIATDPNLTRAVELAQRSLAGLLPDGDLEGAIDAMVELSNVVTRPGGS